MLIPLIGAGVQAGVTALQNSSQRRHERDMYNLQRQHSLEDWNRQNQYNSPEQQMQRLKEAGLNPNLVYGSGSVTANSQQMPRQADMKVSQRQPIAFNPGDMMAQHVSLKQEQQKTDNLAKQNQLLDEQMKYLQAQTLDKLKGVDLKVFNLAKGQSMLSYDLTAADLKNQQTKAMTDKTIQDMWNNIDENARRQLMSQPTIQKTLAQVALLQAQASKIPYEKQVLRARAHNLQIQNNWLGLTNAQAYETNKILQQSALWKNKLAGKELDLKEIEKEERELRLKFRRLGLSETVTSDIIDEIIPLASRKTRR